MRRAANDVDVGVDGADIGHWYCRVIGMPALVMDELPEVVAAEKRDETPTPLFAERGDTSHRGFRERSPPRRGDHSSGCDLKRNLRCSHPARNSFAIELKLST
jgi:hypothetical protein